MNEDVRHQLMLAFDAAKEELRRGDIGVARARLAQLVPAFWSLPEDAWGTLPFSQWGFAVAIAAGEVALAEELSRRLQPNNPYATPLAISPAVALRDWCARSGVVYKQVEASHEVVIAPSTPYSERYSYATEAVEYAQIPGGVLVGGWDFAVASDGTVLIDTCYQRATISMAPYSHFYAPYFGQILHFMPKIEEFVPGNTVRLSAPHMLHFGHWLVDFLPRLRVLDFMSDTSARIAVPIDIPRKFREMLALWGLTDERLFYCRRDTRYRFETLHMLRPGLALPPNPTHVSYVRERLYAPEPTAREGRGSRIFASRGEGHSRTIENWNELQALLDEEGFVEVDFQALSIEDQRMVMADAEILLGVFGSNMFALYFAPSSCTVITIMPNGLSDPSIAHSCAVLGMPHQYLASPATNVGVRKQLKDTRLTIDVGTLRARVRELGRAG